MSTGQWLDGVFYHCYYNFNTQREEYRITRMNEPQIVGTLKIPAEINGRPIVSIGSSSFENCENLEELLYPDTIVSFDEGAFRGCKKLKSIQSFQTDFAPTQHIIFRQNCFADCVSLRTIHTSIQAYVSYQAFENCHRLDNFLPAVKGISWRAFYGCESLQCLTLAHDVEWQKDAFKGCTNLKELVLLGDVSPNVSKTNLKCIKCKQLHCTPQFSYLDWVYEGVDIE
jgi:hypothetical protein